MPSSVSRQNEPNHRLWLACSAGGFGTVVFCFRAAILDSLETMAVWTTDGNIHSSCRNPHALQAKAMIGYPSRQDGAILPARYYLQCPAVKISRKPNNKSFIDQAFSVKMAGYWPHSFLASPSRSKNTKKNEIDQYPAILTSCLVNNPYILLCGNKETDNSLRARPLCATLFSLEICA